jgi:hypothetical protein
MPDDEVDDGAEQTPEELAERAERWANARDQFDGTIFGEGLDAYTIWFPRTREEISEDEADEPDEEAR